jgi:aminoglycoside phosphotransferase (APT) family kinase protein
MRKPDVDPRVVHELAIRALSNAEPLDVERTAHGTSTQVYRIQRGAEIFYLRIGETPEVGHLGPEALVHRLLRERGAKVPELIHYDPFDEALGRSFLVTTEIPGDSLAEDRTTADISAVLVKAGRDLAVVNSLPVAGFGWVLSDPTPLGLRAEWPTHRAFALEMFDQDLARLLGEFLTADDMRAIRSIVARHDAWLDVAESRLVHGDFDVSHIYHQNGRYTGIIDFGEIRGADRLYDLGHYALHDGETLPGLTVEPLLAGYREVAPVTAEDEARIQFWSLLIGVRTLSRVAGRPAASYHQHLAKAIRRAIAALRI